MSVFAAGRVVWRMSFWGLFFIFTALSMHGDAGFSRYPRSAFIVFRSMLVPALPGRTNIGSADRPAVSDLWGGMLK